MGKFKQFFFLNESGLSRKNFEDNIDRFVTFKKKIEKGEEFELEDGKFTIITPSILSTLTDNPKSIPSKILTSNGELSLGKFKKTAEFGSNSGSGGGAVNTKLTESAQCLYCAALFNNIDVNDISNLKNNLSSFKKYFDVDEDIKTILNMDEKWIESSIWSAQTIKDKLVNNHFIWHRGSKTIAAIEEKFTELNKLADSPFGNINKFTPADIWAISKTVDIKTDLAKIGSLYELQNYFLTQFQANNIVGISLKKVVNNSPAWKIYNDGVPTEITYTGNIVTKGKFLSDSIDVYVLYKGNSKGMQYRNTGGKSFAWQGEIKGSAAAGGKCGGGPTYKIVKKYSGKKLSKSSDIVKLVKKKDSKFLKQFYDLAMEYYPVMDYNEYLTKVDKTSPQYIYSKFLGLELLHTLDNINKVTQDKIVQNLVGYGASNTADSAVFVKLGV